MSIKYVIIWLLIGLILYLFTWVLNFITDPHYGQKMNKIYKENGYNPFLKGFLMIILGPLLFPTLLVIILKNK
jgi:hypothetical protein